MYNNNPCQTILSTTAALWFQHDARRLAQFQRRRSGPPLTAVAAAGLVMQPGCRGALTASDLLPWPGDLTEQKQRERFHAQAAV